MIQGLLSRPTSLEAHDYCRSGYSSVICPIGKAHASTKAEYHSVGPLVPALLRSVSPSSVVGLVVSIVVYAINGVRRCWLATHVGKEVLKGAKPAIADRYSSSSVVLKALAGWISASLNHAVPRYKLGSLLWAARVPVRSSASGCIFATIAPARFGVSAPKTVSGNRAHISTPAPAIPMVPSASSRYPSRWCKSYNCKPSKRSSRKVFEVLVARLGFEYYLGRLIHGKYVNWFRGVYGEGFTVDASHNNHCVSIGN